MGFHLESKEGPSPVETPASLEGIDDDMGKRGGTTQDKRDMYRVGRDQELNVSSLRRPLSSPNAGTETNPFEAEL